jgi:glutamate--cysteine ligase
MPRLTTADRTTGEPPEDVPVLDRAAVHGYVKRVCFKTGPPALVGAEVEWLVGFAEDPARPVSLQHLRALLGAIPSPPHGSTITFEPGGQLELSSTPAPDPSTCWRALSADLEHVRRPLAEHGLVLIPSGIDPHRLPRRQLDTPRYRAMEAYFARRGPLGAQMMNSTAAVQVNLALGADAADAVRRWRLLHELAPVLVASFANAPLHAGRPNGWKSGRQRVWLHLDPPRTGVPAAADPVTGWADYALAAPLMLCRRDGADWSAPAAVSFADWVDRGPVPGLPPAPPTFADLDCHLTTLFPPVRPRGWYEVRFLDAQHPRFWAVPMAVLCALLDVPEAGATAARHARRTSSSWAVAARDGLDSPGMADAARGCFRVAVEALSAKGTDPALVDLVAEFVERYVAQGRCPADDVLRPAVTTACSPPTEEP